jgi:phosphoglycolate phosphatase
MLDTQVVLRPGARILHLAPERGIYESLRSIEGVQYDLFDIAPEQYPFASVRRFDLATDVEKLPSRHYDLVIHSHVLEHVPCNATAILFHFHRALVDGGAQLVSIPIMSARYEEDLGDLTDGAQDLDRTLGMVFRLPNTYDLERMFSKELLDRHRIPENARRGFTSHSVFCFRKDDLKLRL